MKSIIESIADLAKNFKYAIYGAQRLNEINNARSDVQQFDLALFKENSPPCSTEPQDKAADLSDSKRKAVKKLEMEKAYAINNAPQAVITAPEKWVKEKGKLGKIADVMFSSTFSKILLIASIPILMFFTSGLFLILGAVVAGSMFIFNLVKEIKTYRDLKVLKKERGLLEAIDYYKGLNKDVAGNLNSTKDKISVKKKERSSKKPSKTQSIAAAVMKAVPETAIAIATSVVAGNPVALGLTIGSAITGVGANASQSVAYQNAKYELIENNEKLADKHSLEYSSAGSHQEELVATLNAQIHRYNKHRPLDVAKVPQVVLQEGPSFLSDAVKVLKDGISWTKNCRNFNPKINDEARQFKPAKALPPVIRADNTRKERKRNRQIESLRVQLHHEHAQKNAKQTHAERARASKGTVPHKAPSI